MTKSQARDIVRRRLNERTADGWNNAEIDGLLDEAVKQVQKSEIAVDAYAYLAIKYVPTVIGSAGEFYELPDDFWYEFEVGYKAAAVGSYVRLTKGNYHVMREMSAGSSPAYAIHGRYLALWPNPTAAIAAGLRIQYMPTLSTGADDADVLPVHPALHMAVPVWATMMAVGETMEDNSALVRELGGYIGDIGAWRHRGGDPIQLRPVLNTTNY